MYQARLKRDFFVISNSCDILIFNTVTLHKVVVKFLYITSLLVLELRMLVSEFNFYSFCQVQENVL